MSTDSVNCVSGKYLAFIGSTSSSGCSTCTPGKISAAGSSSCRSTQPTSQPTKKIIDDTDKIKTSNNLIFFCSLISASVCICGCALFFLRSFMCKHRGASNENNPQISVFQNVTSITHVAQDGIRQRTRQESSETESSNEMAEIEIRKNSLKVIIYSKSPFAKANTSCAVCLSDLDAKDLVKELPCRHVFHASCIDEWLNRSSLCPLCKGDISKQTPRVLTRLPRLAANSSRINSLSEVGRSSTSRRQGAPIGSRPRSEFNSGSIL